MDDITRGFDLATYESDLTPREERARRERERRQADRARSGSIRETRRALRLMDERAA